MKNSAGRGGCYPPRPKEMGTNIFEGLKTIRKKQSLANVLR